MKPFGSTRSVIARNYAFIAPDGHVPAALRGWTNTMGVILISPRMGAEFMQYFALMTEGSQSALPADGVQRFAYVLEGEAQLSVGDRRHVLPAGHFAYLPADTAHTFETNGQSKLNIFEKRYVPTSHSNKKPTVIVGCAKDYSAEPFLGDESAVIATLLPTDVEFDMAVNLFSFESGAVFPFVETHIMEHGLLFVEGQGIYRLDDQFYPIEAGDVIWMGPYCAQWFAAFGKSRSAYLYYKDVNRDPLI